MNDRYQSPMVDGREAVCRACGVTFVYDAAWFRQKHFDPPKHCGDCRRRRRLERLDTSAPMLRPPG